MNVKELKALTAQLQANLQSIISSGNIAFSGEGTSLWTLNTSVKLDIPCTVQSTTNDTYRVIPIMEGITNKDGSQAKSFHLYAGTFYSELETFEDGAKVIVSVVQRIPNKDITSDDLERIDAWAKAQNEADGRSTTRRATDGHRQAIAKKQVTYAITKIVDL